MVSANSSLSTAWATSSPQQVISLRARVHALRPVVGTILCPYHHLSSTNIPEDLPEITVSRSWLQIASLFC